LDGLQLTADIAFK